ncbi:MAG: T9SS type A sorting domain-containing protein, partial [Ignavibacteria bacterium]|nr:T9SS type A sorting domain-containing protein [Ignavibacteria bacterium]
GNGDDIGMAITSDTQGGVVITGKSQGFFSGTNTSDDIITIKYDYFGNQEWLQRYNGPGNSFDGGNSVTTDDNNNVYITGYTFANYRRDLITIKYSLQGNIEWTNKITNPSSASGIKILHSRNRSEIYSIGGEWANTILCYDYAGNLKWQTNYEESMKLASAVLDDNLSMLYLAGSIHLNGKYDYLVTGYNTYLNGGVSWYDIYDGTGSGNDYPSEITIDNFSNIYLTGYSMGSGTGYEYTTLKYNLSGVRQWEKRYNNSGTGNHNAVSISTDNAGSVYVTGFSQNVSGSHDFATIKYAQSIVFGKNENIIPAQFKLHQNYPNPFNPSTKIKFDIPEDSYVNITVYDLLGKKVRVLINETKQAGSYEIDFDASALSTGTYFYEITAGNYREIKKMICIR